jgi:hypothetical protein
VEESHEDLSLAHPRSQPVEQKERLMESFSLQRGTFTHLLLGAFAGFLATVAIGFTWGGWTLERTAKRMAEKSATVAVMAVLAPMCAEKFREDADATANMTELKTVNSWLQEAYIEKGGWATFPGIASPFGVGQACATALR